MVWLIELKKIWSKEEGMVIWRSSNTDKNGTVVEDYMEDNLLVCLNDGMGNKAQYKGSIEIMLGSNNSIRKYSGNQGNIRSIVKWERSLSNNLHGRIRNAKECGNNSTKMEI